MGCKKAEIKELDLFASNFLFNLNELIKERNTLLRKTETE